MKKPIIALSLIIISACSLSACGESSNDWTPDKIINKRHPAEQRSYISVGDKQVLDVDVFVKIEDKKEEKKISFFKRIFSWFRHDK